VRFYSGANIVPLFLLAKVADKTIQDKIVEESKTHLDVIQGNFLDSYRNLTYKCVMGLQWVQNYCNNTKFVVKVDDDTMIDVYHLVRFLLQKSPDGNLENFLYCSVYSNQGPRRTTDDKWYVSESEYPYSKYPPYCEGFAYIMSNDVTKKLYDASRYVKFYWVDDVYVTGFAALQAGVTQRKMEANHGYDLMEARSFSKNVQTNMFLLAKYNRLRRNWHDAWNAIKSYHKKE
jgi:beta-1,3-galactosyltransferase 1